MAQAKFAGPLNERLLQRRKSSFDDHIWRIRTASLKRQIIPFMEFEQKRTSTLSNKQKLKPSRIFSMSEIACRKKFHKNCAPENTYEDLRPNTRENIKGKLNTSSKTTQSSLDSVTEEDPKEYIRNNLSKPRNSIEGKSSFKDGRNNQDEETSYFSSQSTGRNNKIPKLKHQTTKSSVSQKRKKTKHMKTKGRKEKEIINTVQEKLEPYNKDFSGLAEDNRGNFIESEKPLSSSDSIVLNWISELNPKAQNVQSKEHISPKENKKKFPIRVLRKPRNEIAKQNLKVKNKVSKKSNKETVMSKPRNASVKKKAKKEKSRKRNEQKHKTVSFERTSNSFSDDSSESEHTGVKRRREKKDFAINTKGELDGEFHPIASDKYTRGLDNVEMSISENGKLQILLNMNSLSSEDAAVIIWLDDLPKDRMKANLREKLSKNALKNTQSAPGLRDIEKFKSYSAMELEDTASPRPNIFFPSVTILKNLAIDSKSGLRHLKEDLSDSVYYKRCNLDHIES